jgi:hypothetical protein
MRVSTSVGHVLDFWCSLLPYMHFLPEETVQRSVPFCGIFQAWTNRHDDLTIKKSQSSPSSPPPIREPVKPINEEDYLTRARKSGPWTAYRWSSGWSGVTCQRRGALHLLYVGGELLKCWGGEPASGGLERGVVKSGPEARRNFDPRLSRRWRGPIVCIE